MTSTRQMTEEEREAIASPGHPMHRVAPIEPTPGQVKVEAVKTPTTTHEEALWTPEEQQSSGIVKSILRRLDAFGILLARSTKTDQESKIARQLEPRSILFSNPVMLFPAVSANPSTEVAAVCGSRPNRRNVTISVSRLPANVFLYLVKARRSTAPDNTGVQQGFLVPSGGITLRTQDAIYGYVAGSGTVAPSSGTQGTGSGYPIDVAEELY